MKSTQLQNESKQNISTKVIENIRNLPLLDKISISIHKRVATGRGPIIAKSVLALNNSNNNTLRKRDNSDHY